MRSFWSGIGLLLVITAPAHTQEWTAEQREVWEWEKACWAAGSPEKRMGCHHEDFVGWGHGSSVPTTKEDRWPYAVRFFETMETPFFALKPLSIEIRGDMAVLLYLSTYTIRSLETGEETTCTERWTSVAVRDGGRWYWLADHGSMVPGD